MKRKMLGTLLAVSMVASLTACGNETAAPAADTSTPAPAATEAKADDTAKEEVAPAAEEGKVLNVYCWNDEFQRRVAAHYPGYEEVDGSTGKIGDVTVNWKITPSTDNAYQDNLDTNLLKQADAAADEKIDIFLIEADYALKYVDTEFTMPVNELGITDADVANQYQYTKDIVTDSKGVLKGLSWQACPGGLFYNRLAAKDIFGTDDAATIQEKVKDWDTFTKTAEEVKEKGYNMVSSVNDTYRVYSNNVSKKWVVDGKVEPDANILKWVDDSKALVDAGVAGTHDLWGDDWSKGFYPEGKVFCYFGPAWLINFCMGAGNEGALATDGNFGITTGPQGFYWGGTWICAATGTDNPTLVKDIMLKLTTDADIMKEIVVQDDDFVNNKPAMEAMAKDETYKSSVLGGINPLQFYVDGAGSIDLSNQCAYDQGCNEEFQRAMKNYFEGNATKEEALEMFYKNVVVKYPELTK